MNPVLRRQIPRHWVHDGLGGAQTVPEGPRIVATGGALPAARRAKRNPWILARRGARPGGGGGGRLNGGSATPSGRFDYYPRTPRVPSASGGLHPWLQSGAPSGRTDAPSKVSCTPRRCGFTLVELMVSMAVAALLLGGVVSAITLASHALPDAESPLRATTQGYHAAERLADELLVAQSFTQRSATMVEFTVADRDSDTVAEMIRYQWSAVPGDPLTRQYNGGALSAVLEDIHKFDLGYTTKQQSETSTTTVTAQGSETELASFDNWAGVMPTQFLPAPDRWMAEYLQIVPPTGSTSVSITRVKLMMWSATFDPSATVSVAIHKPQTLGSPQPQVTPIGTPAVQLTSLLTPSPAWTDFIFSDVVIDPADTEYVVVVKATNLGTVNVRYYNWKSAPADSHILITTTDSGASWDPRASAHDDNDMPFYVYGTAQTQTTQEITTTKYWIQSVNIALRTGSDAQSEVQTAAQVLNKPEVTGP